jgi:hypothetical protein
MSLRRGLFRLWVVLSVAWIAIGAWWRNVLCEFNLAYHGNGPWCYYQAQDWALHTETAALLIGPPAAAGLIGWVALGFTSESGNSN